MIDQLGGDPADYDNVEDPSSSSDPFLLRGVIEDQEETIDILEEKVANFIETVENLEKIIEKQKDKIELLREESSSVKETLGSKTLEAEGYRSDLEELRVKYEQQGECIMSLAEEIRELENPEDKEFASKSTTMLEDDFFMTTGTDITTSFSHMCHQCNCHLTQSQADLLRSQWSDMDVMPQTFDEDVHSIASGIAQHIVSSYAPPESEMRSNNVTRETEHHAPSVPQPQSQAKHRKDSHRRLTAVKKKEEKGQTREIRTVTQKASAKLPPIDKNKDASPRQATLLGVADLQHKLNFLIQEVMCYVNYAGRVLACGDDGKMCTNPKGVTPITPYSEKRTMAVRVAKERSNVAFFKRKKCRRTMMMTAQRSVILLREIYDAMAKELDLQHSEYEIIYRALKTVQRSQPAINTQHEATSRGQRVTRGHQGQGHPHRCDRPPQTAPSSSGLYASASQPRTNYEDMQQCIKQERVDIFNLDDSRAWRYHDNDSRREMVKTHTATVPKKGQIKVTALDYEIQNPDIYDKAKEPTENREKKPRRHRPKSGKSYLIKRPDILEQIKMGGKLLAEERKQVEGEDVTAYTVRDLTAALSTNDPVTGRRSFISEIRGQMPPAFPLPAGSTPNARRQTVTPALQGHDPGLNPRCPTTATDAPAAYIVTPSAYNITPSGFRQTPGNYAGILAPHSHTPGQYNRIMGRNTQTPGPNGPSTNHSRTLAGHSHSLGLRTSGAPGGGPIAQVYHPNTPGHQPHHNPQAYILTPSAYTLTPATLSPPVQTPNHSPPPCSLPPAPNATKTTTKNKEKHVLLPGINDAHHPNK